MSTILLKFLPFKVLPRHYLPAYMNITYTVKVTLYEIFWQPTAISLYRLQQHVVPVVNIFNTSYYNLVGLSKTRGSAYYELDLPKNNNYDKKNITPINYELK